MIESLVFCRDNCKIIRNTKQNESLDYYKDIIEKDEQDEWVLYYGSIPYDYKNTQHRRRNNSFFSIKCNSSGLFDHANPIYVNKDISRQIIMKIKGISICDKGKKKECKMSYKLYFN